MQEQIHLNKSSLLWKGKNYSAVTASILKPWVCVHNSLSLENKQLKMVLQKILDCYEVPEFMGSYVCVEHFFSNPSIMKNSVLCH